jgi:hypothetical protein
MDSPNTYAVLEVFANKILYCLIYPQQEVGDQEQHLLKQVLQTFHLLLQTRESYQYFHQVKVMQDLATQHISNF